MEKSPSEFLKKLGLSSGRVGVVIGGAGIITSAYFYFSGKVTPYTDLKGTWVSDQPCNELVIEHIGLKISGVCQSRNVLHEIDGKFVDDKTIEFNIRRSQLDLKSNVLTMTGHIIIADKNTLKLKNESWNSAVDQNWSGGEVRNDWQTFVRK